MKTIRQLSLKYGINVEVVERLLPLVCYNQIRLEELLFNINLQQDLGNFKCVPETKHEVGLIFIMNEESQLRRLYLRVKLLFEEMFRRIGFEKIV